MRITQNIIRRDTFASMQRQMKEMATAQSQIASGLRIQRLSDDPSAGPDLLRSNRRLRALEQYRRNMDAADARLRSEESALDRLGDLLTRAKELAFQQSESAANAGRQAAKLEVDGLVATAVDLANTKHGDSYLFGGQFADRQPFTTGGYSDPDFPPSGARTVDIGSGTPFSSNNDGLTVFESSGVFTALRDLSTALAANDEAQIRASINGIDNAFQEVQSLVGENGARANRIEVARANVDAVELNLKQLKSNLEDVELEEAVSELVNRQVAYQSALLATSKILQTTLSDYLR